MVTSTLLPSCFMVARTDAAGTTALSQVAECAHPKRRRKRIVEEPLMALDFDLNRIVPTRCELLY